MGELPVRPNLGQVRRQARELHRSAVRGDRRAAEAALKTAVDADSSRGALPLMEGKHRRPSVYGAGDFLEWAEERGWQPGLLPVGAVFTSQTFITAHLEQRPEPPLAPNLDSVIEGYVALADDEAFLPRAKRLAVSTGAAWPAEYERASVEFFQRMVGVALRVEP